MTHLGSLPFVSQQRGDKHGLWGGEGGGGTDKVGLRRQPPPRPPHGESSVGTRRHFAGGKPPHWSAAAEPTLPRGREGGSEAIFKISTSLGDSHGSVSPDGVPHCFQRCVPDLGPRSKDRPIPRAQLLTLRQANEKFNGAAGVRPLARDPPSKCLGLLIPSETFPGAPWLPAPSARHWNCAETGHGRTGVAGTLVRWPGRAWRRGPGRC